MSSSAGFEVQARRMRACILPVAEETTKHRNHEGPYRDAHDAQQQVPHDAPWGPKPELTTQAGRKSTAGCCVLPRGSSLVYCRDYWTNAMMARLRALDAAAEGPDGRLTVPMQVGKA